MKTTIPAAFKSNPFNPQPSFPVHINQPSEQPDRSFTMHLSKALFKTSISEPLQQANRCAEYKRPILQPIRGVRFDRFGSHCFPGPRHLSREASHGECIRRKAHSMQLLAQVAGPLHVRRRETRVLNAMWTEAQTQPLVVPPHSPPRTCPSPSSPAETRPPQTEICPSQCSPPLGAQRSCSPRPASPWG